MKGRIFQRSNQKAQGQGWSWCVDLSRKPGERRQQVTGTSRTTREAEAEVARVIAEGKSRLRKDDPGNMTVEKYFDEWIDAHSTRVSATTIERYVGIVHDHVLPALGRRKSLSLAPEISTAS